MLPGPSPQIPLQIEGEGQASLRPAVAQGGLPQAFMSPREEGPSWAGPATWAAAAKPAFFYSCVVLLLANPAACRCWRRPCQIHPNILAWHQGGMLMWKFKEPLGFKSEF